MSITKFFLLCAIIVTNLILFTACGKKSSALDNVIENNIEESPHCRLLFKDNPLKITDIKPMLNKGGTARIWSVKFLTPEGDLKYNDEDAENYYDDYAFLFAFTEVVCQSLNSDSISNNTKKYVVDNLFDVMCNMPLGDNYPDSVKQVINKVYYDTKDLFTNTLSRIERKYGEIIYGYKYKAVRKAFVGYDPYWGWPKYEDEEFVALAEITLKRGEDDELMYLIINK